MAACYHRECGRTFGGLSGFDRHLVWSDTPPFVSCTDPSRRGMVLTPDGMWVRPAPAVGTQVA